MTGALVPHGGSLDSAGTVAELVALQRWARTADGADDLAETAAKAKTARELVKVFKAAGEIAAEATRLECICLRRLGQLGEHTRGRRLSGTYKGAAQTFADLDDAEFNDLLDHELLNDYGETRSAVGVARIATKRQQWRYAEQGADIMRRTGNGPHLLAPSIDDLHRAAATLLNQLYVDPNHESVTVQEAADRLADGLDPNRRWTTTEGLAFREVIRDAFMEGTAVADLIDPFPHYVTYQSDELGWVRIPFRHASIEQLEWMASYRREQARQMGAAADKLDEAVGMLRHGQKGHPAVTKCGDLYDLIKRHFKRWGRAA